MQRIWISGVCVAVGLTSSAVADVTVTFTNQTWTGFNFSDLTVAYGGFYGTLTGVSVNATLNASVSYTYADDLCVYVDPAALATGGLLQVGGFSNLNAAQRITWANGNSSAPGTTVIDSVAVNAITFNGSASDPIIWIGNGYGASGTSGTWTGSITLHGICPGPPFDTDNDGIPNCFDPCRLEPGPCNGCPITPCGSCEPAVDIDADGIIDCLDNCPATFNPSQTDCDLDGIGDACATSGDCNGNGIPDACEIAKDPNLDLNGNGIPDPCDPDCNGNGIADHIDIANGSSADCNANGIPNECEARLVTVSTGNMGPLSGTADITGPIAGAVHADGDVTLRVEAIGDLGAPTEFASLTIANGPSTVVVSQTLFQQNGVDCGTSALVAELTVSRATWNQLVGSGQAALVVRMRGSTLVDPLQCANASTVVSVRYRAELADCDADGTPDLCEAVGNDCNANGVPDSCDVGPGGPSADLDGNGQPDECQVDCNANSIPDAWEISQGLTGDCDGNGRPDACDLASGDAVDCNANGTPDACEVTAGTASDCDGDGVLDSCEVAAGAADCNANSIPDSCDIAPGGASRDVDGDGQPDECQPDCNANGVPDAWEVSGGLVADCDSNGQPDSCDIASGAGDCDSDGVLDSCEVTSGATDKDGDGRPDDCEYARGDFNLDGQVDGSDLGYLLAIWGLPGQVIGDFDANGTINGADLGVLLSNWGTLTD